MRQAIITRYMGPTSHKGSRIKARAEAGAVIDNWDHGSSIEENHCRVAKLLAAKLAKQGGRGWCGMWVAGGLPSNDGNCFVSMGLNNPEGPVEADMEGNEGRDWFFLPLSAAAAHEKRAHA